MSEPPADNATPSALDRLLDDLGEHDVRRALQDLPSGWTVVADPASQRALEAGGLLPERTPLLPTNSPADGATALSAAAHVLVIAPGAESATVAAVRALRPSAPVHGLVADLLPRCAAGLAPDAAPRPSHGGYVIACPPRSGSYHLCGLLASLGLGAPDEHLDQGLCRAARRGEVDLLQYLDRLTEFAGAGGWFGTKLIAHVLFAAVDAGLSPDSFRTWLERHALQVIHLRRRDLNAQAVSNFVARHTGAWTQHHDGPPPPRPAYDFAAIHGDWEDLRRQDLLLQQIVGQLGRPVVELLYEDLDARPEHELARIRSALTGEVVSAADVQATPRTRKQRDAESLEYAARFASDLARRGLVG